MFRNESPFSNEILCESKLDHSELKNEQYKFKRQRFSQKNDGKPTSLQTP